MTERASRRERPAKPALSRDGIIGLALDLLRREGLERVTMRRLATELDTGPASLYVYVRNTDDLHAAVLDAVLGTVELTPGGGDWSDRLIRLLVSYTRVLFDHPGLARTALLTWPSGPNYLNLVELILRLLDEGGLPGDRAAWLADLLLQVTTATAAEHSGDAGAGHEDMRAAVLDVSADRHPRMAALGPELFSGNKTDRLEWGLRVLLNGAFTTGRPA